jgi:hypothetical protein
MAPASRRCSRRCSWLWVASWCVCSFEECVLPLRNRVCISNISAATGSGQRGGGAGRRSLHSTRQAVCTGDRDFTTALALDSINPSCRWRLICATARWSSLVLSPTNWGEACWDSLWRWGYVSLGRLQVSLPYHPPYRAQGHDRRLQRHLLGTCAGKQAWCSFHGVTCR